MNARNSRPWPPAVRFSEEETPIPETYLDIDTDLARDNLENDIPAADLQDIYCSPAPKLNLQFKQADEFPDPI